MIETTVSLESSRILLLPRFKIPTLFSYKVKDPLIAGLIQTESSFILHNISSSNAVGLFQMKPFLAYEIGIQNPFFPYNEKKVSEYLQSLSTKYGGMGKALAAYRIGQTAISNLQKSGGDALANPQVSEYVKKIQGFQRQYSVGQNVRLYDYLWFGIEFLSSLHDQNSAKALLLIPTAWFGTTGIVLSYQGFFDLDLYQEFMINSTLQIMVGFENSPLIGISLRSNTWFDQISIAYDFGNNSLQWEGLFRRKNWGLQFNSTKEDFKITGSWISGNGMQISLGIKVSQAILPFIEFRYVF